MSDDTELQREITRVALRALEGTDFALAGSGGLREHGIVDRLTHDIDLFTSNADASAFDVAVEALVGELKHLGYIVDLIRQAPQFAQLRVTVAGGLSIDMDLAVDWREVKAVMLSVGPVLSLQDAVGNKISALYSRAEARDYLDVDAIRASGRVTDAELIRSVRERDAGFEVSVFARQLDQFQRIKADRFSEYGVNAKQVDAIKQRFVEWAAELRSTIPNID